MRRCRPGVYRAQLTLCFAEALTIFTVEDIQPLALLAKSARVWACIK
jgi:hypothetical protein